MDSEAVLAVFDQQMRRDAAAESPGGVVERVGGVVRQVGAEHEWNGVVWSDLDEDTADAAIAAQVRHFTSRGLEFEWKLYSHDRPADLGDRLRAAGFVPEPPETLLVARVEDLPVEVRLPDGVRLVPVTDEAGLDLVTAVHEQVFGTDGSRLRQRMLDRLTTDPESLSVVLAMAGEQPVCAARLEFNPGTAFAGLWGGGTLPEWRGRGIYRAMVAHRAHIAAERGYRYLQVDASDQSSPILRRLGFAALSTTTPYLHQP
ncbi:GNAT family N-acetyltransferase [Saccharothrix sp. ST-888]|uniref:GNAT family N-acetyltransferase n=1 Tax=Saccharothrix sp. ST-888 TaxID=1427391 RepID=UPI0005EC3437|nr:GNAT family N-acetyltransferase [Saccharothrix sp. ST-888]KJK56966.1 GCN5 family acetyltransferase [Saccharothrix sp. ST-888]